LAPVSACINGAAPPASGTPDHEYYEDESVTREYRLRATAHDIGAFEATTNGTGVGPGGATTQPSTGGAGNPATGGSTAMGGVGAVSLGGAANVGGSAQSGTVTNSAGRSNDAGSCGCKLLGTHKSHPPLAALAALLVAAVLRRHQR
jgi:hypothetical protein